MIMEMFRKNFIVIVLCFFACGKTYGQSGMAVHCDSVFYKLVLWDFNVNGHCVPLMVTTNNEQYCAMNSNDFLSMYIQYKMNLGWNDSQYVVYVKHILENQETLDVEDSDFVSYGFRKVIIDSALVRKVEKNRMKFIRKYFKYKHYYYYFPDFFTNSDSIIYKEEVKSYTIRQDIPYEKQLCVIFLLLERNVAINTIVGYDGTIDYIGPYQDSPGWEMKCRRIKGKRAVRLLRKYGFSYQMKNN